MIWLSIPLDVNEHDVMDVHRLGPYELSRSLKPSLLPMDFRTHYLFHQVHLHVARCQIVFDTLLLDLPTNNSSPWAIS